MVKKNFDHMLELIIFAPDFVILLSQTLLYTRINQNTVRLKDR